MNFYILSPAVGGGKYKPLNIHILYSILKSNLGGNIYERQI